MTIQKDLILTFFDMHPEVIGETCKNCCNNEKTCAEQLIEQLEKFE